MTSRRNTIQKDLVRNAVYEMRRHVTANEVYEFIKEAYPTIGKGTVYRNLDILVEEGALRKVEVSDGPNRFDFTLKNHYHVRCIKCGEILMWIWIKYRICWKEFITLMELSFWIMIFHLKASARNAGRR